MLRFFIYGLLAAASMAQAQPFHDYEAGSNSGPCRIKDAAGRESWRFVWSGRCANGYAQGEGTLRVWRPGTATVEQGTFSAGKRQGVWQTYARQTEGDREITNFLVQYEGGVEKKDAQSMGGVRPARARDLPGWAEVLAGPNYANVPPPPKPSAPAPTATPKPAATAKAVAPAAALPALSADYKGHLYVVRFDVADAKGTHGDFMSYIAPDRARAQRLYDEYVAGRSSLTEQGKPSLVSIDECDGRGAGPYFALAVLHEARDGSSGGGGWICGAPSADAAAKGALGACKTAAGEACSPRAEAQLYVLVSTHATEGSSQVRELATFGGTGASTRVWNNYDYTGCLWTSGKLDAEGGPASSTLKLDCLAYF